MDVSLPTHLNERFRWRVDPSGAGGDPGAYILYWMHNALRAHENPALDVAICLARQNGLPLLVYHGLSEDYPYSSDRYHAFILQGQRDVQRQLTDRGIASYFHLERDGQRGPHLRNLTRKAALLVTEEMPVQPLAGWMERLVKGTKTPIAMVDATCVVPVPLVEKAYTRAFEYRNATKELYEQRLQREYVEQEVDCEMYDGPIPFTPMDLQDVSLAELIGQCRVDHAIGPVADTPGGSRAGYRRWERFKEGGLKLYSQRRNDASIHEGVSRLSAYLHFGMVSPLRIAREAKQEGAEKFLDELLVWRELSFHFCHHNIDIIDSVDALPTWAQQTLSEHSSDQRQVNYGWEALARAKSGQPLWDACQRSLLKHGELHNNVRMTWGKAFLPWASSPARAMKLTMDLNHRYALDGRDPSSYGGVLWCFGQFDRPFSPENPVTGTVRRRSCEDHQKRLDLASYCRVVDRPIAASLPKVAVVGAGVAGLMCARTLSDHGIDVTILEKSNGVGGRLATRQLSDQVAIDHGAQYFTARDQRFTRYVQSWVQQGLVQPWMGRIVELAPGGRVVDEKLGTPRFVGVPGMNSIAVHLAEDLSVQYQTRVETLVPCNDGKWQVFSDQQQDCGVYDIVIANCPPAQSLPILKDSGLVETIRRVEMQPCWALMVVGESLSSLSFDGAFVNEGPLSWIARNDRKPGRGSTATCTAHASPEWSEQHLESEPADVQPALHRALEDAIGQPMDDATMETVHRWRYSIPSKPLEDECLWDPATNLGACGDWCAGSRVEGAFLSGMAIAGAVLRHLTIDRPAFATAESRPMSLIAGDL